MKWLQLDSYFLHFLRKHKLWYLTEDWFHSWYQGTWARRSPVRTRVHSTCSGKGPDPRKFIILPTKTQSLHSRGILKSSGCGQPALREWVGEFGLGTLCHFRRKEFLEVIPPLWGRCSWEKKIILVLDSPTSMHQKEPGFLLQELARPEEPYRPITERKGNVSVSRDLVAPVKRNHMDLQKCVLAGRETSQKLTH